MLIFPLTLSAQKGPEIKVNVGFGGIGSDPWMESGMVSGTFMYNINGSIAFGALYSQSFGGNYFYFERENKFGASLEELGAIVQINYLRRGKLKLYGDLSLARISAATDVPVEGWQDGSVIEDEATAFGIGTGGLLNLGGGFYWNFLEFRVRLMPSDFMEMDLEDSSAGIMGVLRTGILFNIKHR